MHRLVPIAAGLFLVIGSAAASAAERTLYVAGYGGSFEQTIRKDVIPGFAKAHDVEVEYIAGNSTDTLAKLQAQRGHQQIDVAIVDDGPMYQAIQLGFCNKITGLPADLYDAARYSDNRAVGIGLVATGLMYNTKIFADRHWAAPTSWKDLEDPKFKGLIVIPPINNTYGLYTLLMLARMGGGGAEDIEPGFKAMKTEVNPNVLAYEPSPGKMTELFESGQAALAVWGSGRVASLAATGFPVDFVYPKEGAVTLVASACPIDRPDASPLASAFIEAMLQPSVQLTLLKEYGYGPVVKSVEITPAIVGMAPVGARAAALYTPDWTAINQHREEWTKRWNREVER